MDFVTLKDYPNYEIYENGMIISRRKIGMGGKILKRKEIRPTRAKNGYCTVKLCGSDGRIRQFYLHRLVYMAFNGSIGNLEVEHKDGNRANNALSNLRATTHKENCSNEVSKERYRIANSMDKGKYDYEHLQLARTDEYREKLIATYKALYLEYGKVGVMMLMKDGHCNYYRAKRLIAEMEAKSTINQRYTNN